MSCYGGGRDDLTLGLEELRDSCAARSKFRQHSIHTTYSLNNVQSTPHIDFLSGPPGYCIIVRKPCECIVKPRLLNQALLNSLPTGAMVMNWLASTTSTLPHASTADFTARLPTSGSEMSPESTRTWAPGTPFSMSFLTTLGLFSASDINVASAS